MRARAYFGMTLLAGSALFCLRGALLPPATLGGEEPKQQAAPAILPVDFDPEAEREKTAKALVLFGKGSNSLKDRLKAAENIGAVTKEGGETLFAVFHNREEPDEIRVVALQKSPVTEQLIKAAAKVVKDQQGKRLLRYECVGFLAHGRGLRPRRTHERRGGVPRSAPRGSWTPRKMCDTVQRATSS